MSNSGTIKLLIADDHEIFLDGFKLMLSKFTDIELVGEATNGRELLELTAAFLPDVIITDIKMPILDGIEATKQIAEQFPKIGIIGLSMFDEDDLIIDMLEAGAKGFLIKNAGKLEIVDGIKTVYNGQPYYCTTTSHKLTHMIAKSKFNPYKKAAPKEFTEREKEFLHYSTTEMSYKEIAEKMFCSPRTVESYRDSLFEKLNLKTRVGLAVFALKNGFAS
jgi:two-component system, NarL family, response regulator NreC